MASLEEEKKIEFISQKTNEEKELVKELSPASLDINKQKLQEIEISDDKLECPQYIKEDSLSGFLSNKDEIENYKRKQQIDIMRNQLLGEFDKNGSYFLSPEIINELKNVKKEIVEQYKTYIFLHSVQPIKGYGNISFFVSISKMPTGQLKAKLVLLEKIERVNGFIINTISASIDEFIGESTADYYESMKKYFNIVKVDQKDIAEEEETLKYCTLRKLQLSELWRNVNTKIEKIEKNVFEKKINALKKLKDNPFAQQLLEEFYKESAKIDKIFLRDSNEKYIALNTLLDECFDKMNGKMPIEEKQVETVLLDAGKDAISLQEDIISSIIVEAYQKAEEIFYNIDNVIEDAIDSKISSTIQEQTFQEQTFQEQNQTQEFKKETNRSLPSNNVGTIVEEEVTSEINSFIPITSTPTPEILEGESLDFIDKEEIDNTKTKLDKNEETVDENNLEIHKKEKEEIFELEL